MTPRSESNGALGSLFSIDPSGQLEGQTCLRGAFLDYSGEVRFAVEEAPPTGEMERRRKIGSVLSAAHHDVWACFCLIERLAWMNHQAATGALNEGHYNIWSRLDVESYHVQLRSIYDYAAEAMQVAVGLSKQRSFRELTRWLSKPVNQETFGATLTEAVRSARGFHTIRLIRDGLVHQGAHTIIFGEPARGIVFQVYDRGDNSISLQGVMDTKNALDFKRYAVQSLGDTLLFLERMASALQVVVPVSGFGSRNARSYSPGMATFVEWIEAAPHLPCPWSQITAEEQ